MKSSRQEAAELADEDARLLSRLEHKLAHFAFKVNSCGESGDAEMEKARELARQAIKVLVNYL